MFTLAYRIVEPAKYLVIVGIAYTLATAGWYLVSGPTPAALTDAPTQARSSGKPALSVAEIAARNLFGQASATASTPAVFDAPETRLRLNLEGVFQAEVPEESAAIVAEQGRPGELVLVGGRLPGNAVLTEVHADRIVLRRGTVFETLKFADEPTVLTAAANRVEDVQPQEIYDPGDISEPETYSEPTIEAPPEATSGGITTNGSNSAALTSVVQNYRERLQADPAGTLSSLGVAPVSSSGAQGYRLDNLAGSPYLAQTGLQAGDVVLSVNGRPVGDVQQDQLQIDNIVAQGSARLEVQRGTRRFFVTASLK